MMSRFFRFGLLALAMAVSGCGTESQSPGAQVIRGVGALLQTGPKAPPPGPDDLLTRDVIDQVTVPYGMVGIERRGAYASMTLAGQNGAHDSWVTSDGAGIVLMNGLLTRTTGLGADLATTELNGLDRMVRAGSGAGSRVHEYIDGEGRIFAVQYACTVASAGSETITIIGRSHATRVVVETCSSGSDQFENRYWIGVSDGVVWQSRQWVSAGVGHAIVLSLVPVAR